jgi:hypothetical protein
VIANVPIRAEMRDVWMIVIANDPIRAEMRDVWTLVIANDPEPVVECNGSAIASRLRG